MAFFMKHETDHEQIKERIVSAANMPKDVMLGASVLTILGNFEVCIENYRGILYYTNDEMKITGKISSLEFCG